MSSIVHYSNKTKMCSPSDFLENSMYYCCMFSVFIQLRKSFKLRYLSLTWSFVLHELNKLYMALQAQWCERGKKGSSPQIRESDAASVLEANYSHYWAVEQMDDLDMSHRLRGSKMFVQHSLMVTDSYEFFQVYSYKQLQYSYLTVLMLFSLVRCEK